MHALEPPSVIVLLVIAILLAANALYVGAEFATLGVRRHRVQRRAEDGSLRARTLMPVLSDTVRLNRYLSTCQLGITASTLILGAYARRVLGGSLVPFLEGSGLARAAAETVSFALILTGITAVQVVLTEQVPKSVVLRDPLRWSLVLVLPLRLSEMVLAGFIAVLQGSASGILRLLGFSSRGRPLPHSPAEIGLIVAESARVASSGANSRRGCAMHCASPRAPRATSWCRGFGCAAFPMTWACRSCCASTPSRSTRACRSIRGRWMSSWAWCTPRMFCCRPPARR
ncbi:MAG: DUF21 domain-containing protein [Acidobacteria bacterium]|nr:MAG: DUF21 domain-containing protein [Acidobacteriota bacterium]